MKSIFTLMYMAMMLAAAVLYAGGIGTDGYSEWQTIIVNGKSRTPQGSFYVTSGGTEFTIFGPYKKTREFWHRVDYFDQVEVRIAESFFGSKRIAALKFRDEIMYGIDDFEKGLSEKRSMSLINMKYISIIYAIIIGVLVFRERSPEGQ